MTMALGGADVPRARAAGARTRSPARSAPPRPPAARRGSTAPQMRWLLDYASQQAGGYAVWGRDTDHIEKGFVFGGMPARNGVTAALLVRAGWNGVDDVFSGDDNFFQVHAPDGRPCPARRRARRALRGGQHRHQEVERRHAHPGAARRDREPPPAAALRRPTTSRAWWSGWRRRSAPSSTTARCPDICLQHMVAVMLLDRTASFKAAHDKPRMQDAAVLRQRAKVQLRARRVAGGAAPGACRGRGGHADRRHAAVRPRGSGARHAAQSDDA